MSTTPKKTKEPTQKQQALIRLLKENCGRTGKAKKTMEQILLEAGYTQNTALHNGKVIIQSATVVEAIDPYIQMLDDKRKLALTYITEKKMKKTSPYLLALTNDVLTKNHQLLTGKATGRVDILDDEERKRIDGLFKRNNK